MKRRQKVEVPLRLRSGQSYGKSFDTSTRLNTGCAQNKTFDTSALPGAGFAHVKSFGSAQEKFWFDRYGEFGYCKMAKQDRQMFVIFIYRGDGMVDAGLYELVEKILWAVGFIAVGGVLALMFFLVFAQSILGSKTIHSQLEALLQQSRQINEQLKQIAQHLEKEKDNSRN